MAAERPNHLALHAKLLVMGNNAGQAAIVAAVAIHFLYFLTDVVGMTAGLAGTLMLLARIFDGLNDPLVGVWSDRTRSRLGRRRVFVLFGAVPLALLALPLWTAPGLAPTLNFIWMFVAFAAFDSFFTLVQVPSKSWEIELTFDYHERTRLAAFSGFGGVVGYLAGAAGFPWVASVSGVPADGYRYAGLAMGLFSGFFALLLALFLRERADRPQTPPKRFSRQAYLSTLKNVPFYRLQASFFLARIAFTLMAATIPYYCTHWLGDRAILPKAMAILIAGVAVCLPLWRMIALRFEKAKTFSTGLAFAALSGCAIFFVPSNQAWLALAIVGLVGCGVSVQWVMPPALVADTLDVDELLTQERREGLYVGVAAVLDRMAGALGIVSLGWGLAAFGYGEGHDISASASVLMGVRLFVGPLPAVLLLLSAAITWRHPIDQAAHEALRSKIDALKSRSDVLRPLTGSSVSNAPSVSNALNAPNHSNVPNGMFDLTESSSARPDRPDQTL
ncbi:MAG: MFS transporter [Deltaproteobacteria bacterium]|nr:MFS transporter [Deltaproteobacteria bacterium]